MKVLAAVFGGFCAIALALGASAPASADETNYAKLGRWSVTAVTNGANIAYCSADIDNGKVQLRLTTDGKSWRVGVPYYESRKKVQGYYGFGDAAEVASFSVTGDGWAFIPIGGDQVNAFRSNPAFSINLDRGLQTWTLAGAGPALDKAGECARNGGRPQQAKLTLAAGQFGMRAGPIFSNAEAKAKCTAACTLTFDGNWVTTTQGKTSICHGKNSAGFGILDSAGKGAGLVAGPIWNQGEAKPKCDAALQSSRWVENNWITTEQGKMSMCACTGKILTWK